MRVQSISVVTSIIGLVLLAGAAWGQQVPRDERPREQRPAERDDRRDMDDERPRREPARRSEQRADENRGLNARPRDGEHADVRREGQPLPRFRGGDRRMEDRAGQERNEGPRRAQGFRLDQERPRADRRPDAEGRRLPPEARERLRERFGERMRDPQFRRELRERLQHRRCMQDGPRHNARAPEGDRPGPPDMRGRRPMPPRELGEQRPEGRREMMERHPDL